MDQANRPFYSRRNQSYKFLEAECFGANRVADRTPLLVNGVNEQLRHVLHVDGTNRVPPVAWNPEHGKTAHEPGNVVDEYVFRPKNDGGPQDCVRQPRADYGLFDLGFSPVVPQRRFERWIGDADVHDPLDTGVFCRLDQRAGISNRGLEVRLSARKAHPIGINKSGRASKAAAQILGTVEVIGKYLNPVAKRIRPVGMICQSADFVTAVEEEPRGVFSRVTEGTGDDHRRTHRCPPETDHSVRTEQGGKKKGSYPAFFRTFAPMRNNFRTVPVGSRFIWSCSSVTASKKPAIAPSRSRV